MAKNYVTSFRGDHFMTPVGKVLIKDEPETPIDEDFGDHNHLESSFNSEQIQMRKSLSMNDITTLREDLMGLDLNNDKEEVYQRYRVAPQELSKTKYVSMAEAIYHYERDTPGRFHSKRPQTFRPQSGYGHSGLTIPQSPMLRCRGRSRPIHVMSQKEKDEMELEEIRKFKLKANPVPKAVLLGNKNLPDVPRKPATIPEPFNLTEVHKKPPESPKEQVVFKARPAPKHILEKPQVPPKPPVHITKPVTPKFHYKRSQSNDCLKAANQNSQPRNRVKSAEKQAQRVGPIYPIPFSFEKRDEEMKKRREQRIKQQIEEERKQASQFKAQPLPGAVKKQMRNTTIRGSASATSSQTSENKENHHRFEARPPVVLYKEPFKPIHPQPQLVKPAPFHLASEKRAVEREKFDKLLKEKEEEQERIRQQREKEQQQAEEKSKAELRAKLVHHAKPIPVNVKNPYIPEKSVAALTIPETPKFIRRMRQNI